MSSIERANQFLLDVLEAKKTQYISRDDIYKMLIRNDVDSKDMSLDSATNGNFDRWCQKYGRYDGTHIHAFVDPMWSYFCQFKNRSGEVIDAMDQIKVYIPLDGEHLTHGVEQIFDFLEKNNIAHLSKVGKHVRFDDVVIRLGNLDDAEKLHNFIKSNSYIQEGLIKSNPFAVTRDGIAYAADKDISYNSAVCDFINVYVNDVLRTGDYTDFGIDGFRKFILNYYNDVILNPDNAERFYKECKYAEISGVHNYMRVAELLYKCLDPNFTYEDYAEHYTNNIINYYRAPELAYNYNVDYAPSIEDTEELTESSQITSPDNKVYDLMKKTLIEFGKAMLPDGSRKYSNDDVINQLYAYFDSGNLSYITRSGGLRQDFVENDFRNMLTSYLSTTGISFGDVLLESKKQILNDSLIANQNKYGDSCDLSLSIRLLLDEGTYDGFTRTNGARENMVAAVGVKDISNIILREMNYPPNVTLSDFSREDRNQIIEQYVSYVKEKQNTGSYGGK